jgi:hypothetical protein
MEPFALSIGIFKLTEPVTALSDLLLTMLCFSIAVRLKKYKTLSSSIPSWQTFFVIMGISTFTGVLVHGLRNYQTEETHNQFWMGMNVISGVSIYFAQIATVKGILSHSKYGPTLRLVATIQVAAYLVCIALFQIAAGMIPVLILNFYDFKKGTPGGAWMGTGIAISFISAVFHTLKLSISERWFNYNDISHVFIATSFIFMARGLDLRMKKQISLSV